MSAHKDPPEWVNEVRLVGRVSGEPEPRELPSGDVVVTFRVTVRRPEGHATRQTVDAVDCAAWASRPRRSVGTWRVGDVVEVSGALRRRFFQTGSGAASRCEVEVASARVIRRAASG
ncbi:MAG: single-stranded DNA-binding protein [Nocardioides sp.]